MNRYIIILFLLLLFIMLYINGHSNNWSIYRINLDKSNCIGLLNKGKNIIYFGYNNQVYNKSLSDYENFQLNENVAYIIDKRDNKKKIYSKYGEIFSCISKQNEKIFALTIKYSKSDVVYTYILETDYNGEYWKILPITPVKFDGINFSSKFVAYGWTEKDIYASYDNGTTWHKFFEKKINIDPAVSQNGDIWIAGNNTIFFAKLHGKEGIKSIHFKNCIKQIFSENDDILWILSSSKNNGNDNIQIHKIEKKVIKKISELNIFLPDLFYAIGKNIYIIGNENTTKPKSYFNYSDPIFMYSFSLTVASIIMHN